MNAKSAVVLRVENLSVSYGQAEPAIDEVGFEVRAGEMVAILGANGAGKTTMMQATAGLLKARSGRIWLCDREITHAAAHKRALGGLGLALEGHQVVDELTVEDNLRLVLHARRRSLDRASMSKRIEEACGMFPILGDRLNQLAGSLSGGQQQMLVIGRLLVSDASVLMLDEPSLGLAPAVSEQVYARLAQLRDAGRAIVLVEQNAALAADVSDHLFLLRRGQLLKSGEGSRFSREDIQSAYLAS